MNDAHEQELRREAFLSWADDELQNLDRLQVANNEASLLTRYKKTILFGILETLAKAFDTSPSSWTRFENLVEAQGVWEDATRISVVHLARALDLHLSQSESQSKGFDDLRTYLKEDFAWAFETALCSAEESTIKNDPDYGSIESRWPGCTRSNKLKANKKLLALSEFKHSNLLYTYRSCMVHEAREQTCSMNEKENDCDPVYLVVSNPFNKEDEFHLVYPVVFLEQLARSCIDMLRENESFQQRNLHSNFKFGPYIIQELN